MKIPSLILILFIISLSSLNAQQLPGLPEIAQGRDMMAQNFGALCRAALVLGAIFGIVGGLRVYSNWQLGKRHMDGEVAGWLGACIFLSLLGVFLSALYGVPLA